MSADDFFKYLFRDSQVDTAREEILKEAAEAEALEMRKTPLVNALKALKISTDGIEIDELGGRLVFADEASWHEAVKVLGTVDAMNSLADEGWVPEFAGDVAPEANGQSVFVLNFLNLHDIEPSELNKPVAADKFNSEFEKASDTQVPKEQEERDRARRHGVSVGESEADKLLEDAPAESAETDGTLN